MSLETWMKEFYPTPAHNCPAEDAVAHSLREWEGLRPENLKRHGCKLAGRCVIDEGDRLEVDAETCALCAHYNVARGDGCRRCPLTHVRDGVGCDKRMEGGDLEAFSPWAKFVTFGAVEPMIEWLKKAREWEANK